MNKAMTWLVFALGLLLMVLGSAFLYNGFGLIEIERGAAQVSAGASLLAGGVVTLGFSVILMQMQEAIAMFTRQGRAQPQRSDRNEVAPEDETSLPIMAAGGTAGAGAAVAAGMAGFDNKSFHKPVQEEAASPPAPTVPAELAAVAQPVEPNFGMAMPTAEPPIGDTPKAAPAVEPVVEPASANVVAWPTRAAAPVSPPIPAEVAAPQADQAADDWFERMFAEPDVKAELGHDVVAQTDAPSGSAQPAEAAPPAMEPAHLPDAHLPHVEAAKPLPHAQPEHAAPTHPVSEVVARHEADGITYTMYADGSIDADDGVTSRHFASMDELAASIKG